MTLSWSSKILLLILIYYFIHLFPIFPCVSRYKNQYDAVGIFGARKPQLLIINAELARRVMVTDFKNFHDNDVSLLIDEKSDFIFANNPFTLTGEKWKTRRADVTPGLTQSRVG